MFTNFEIFSMLLTKCSINISFHYMKYILSFAIGRFNSDTLHRIEYYKVVYIIKKFSTFVVLQNLKIILSASA